MRHRPPRPPRPSSLSRLADAELAGLAREGDEQALEALIARYRRFARARARAYFLVGGDADDLEQEALIGLYKAVRDFRVEERATFRAFAELCITRQIITAIKTATRHKHQPLNQYVSINAPRTDEGTDERTSDEILIDLTDQDPADRLVAGERAGEVRDTVHRVLSDLEVDVLRLYVEGRSYQEISERLGRHTKSIDNALQRIKRKLSDELAPRAGVPVPS